MATTEVFYNGDGSDVTFTIPFEYLEESDVKVSVGGTLKTQDTDYTFSTLTEITFTTAPPTGTNNVRIFRDTEIETLRNEFFAGSAIRAQDLNDNFLQTLYSAQEIGDQYVTQSDASFITNVDMNGNRITDMGDPVNAQDAVTKQYLEDNYFDDGTETIVAAETWPDNDTTIATTAAIDNRVDSKIDTALETDVLVDSTGLAKSATGGQVTLGIAANSVDLDRIKDSDKITLSEQVSDNDQVGTDDQIFTAKAATRRFNNYYQNDAPTDTDGVGIGQVWVDPNDDLTLSVWTGSNWVGITSGGTFSNQPKVIYVDTASGDDTNDGHRISRPKKTIAAALSDINGDSSGDGSIISVAPGIYAETLPLDIQKNDIGIIGQSLRTCIIHPKIPTADQATYDVDTPHSQELQTMFRVNSGSYFANLTLTGLKASGTRGGSSLYSDSTYGLPTNQGWNFAFYPNAVIKKSPYIQNVTNFSDSQINNVTFTPHTPGEGAAGDLDSAPTGGGILIDGSVPATTSPLRSMVCDSYTHTALDGPGIFVTNNGYCQATSSYAFFNHAHITCVNGGQANLAASTTDFGRYGLIADGKSSSAIFTSNVDGAASSGATSFNINEPTAGSGWFGDTERPATNMLVEVNSVIYPILSATARTDSEGGSGWTVTISRPDSSNRSNNLGLNGAISDNAAVSFYLRSMIASSGHTMEYVGSGTDYRALPENGGVPTEANQKIERNNGKIWTATTDHNGKFTIGGNQTDAPFFQVDQQLGFVTIPEGSIAFNLLSDATPQLGGNLDVKARTINTSTTNGNISLDPNGTGTVDVNTSRITSVTDPTGAQDAATKAYVDGLSYATGAITSAMIAAGTIVDSDVNASAAIDASKLSHTYDDTNATPRTVESKLDDVVSVKDFGAVGDNSTDDTTAINNALGAMEEGQVLYFPPGTYKITSAITITKPVGIRGDSPDVTCLQFHDCNGIKWDLSSYTDNYSTVVIDGLCFETTVDGTRTGLQYEGKQFFAPKAGRIYMTNCWLRGIDSTKQWLTAMDLEWAYKSYFEAVWVYGRESSSTDGFPIDTTGIKVNNTTGCVFEHCDVYRVKTAWTLTGQSEGNNWNNGVVVATFNGFIFTGLVNPANHQTISNYHIASEQTCIDIQENTSANATIGHYITNVFFLQRTSAGSHANNNSSPADGMTDWKAIKCDNVNKSFFVNILALSNFNSSLDLTNANSSVISFEADCTNNYVSNIHADRITRAINSGTTDVENNTVTGVTLLNGAVTCLDTFRTVNAITETVNTGSLEITGRVVNLNSANGKLINLPDKGATVDNNAFLRVESTTGTITENVTLTAIANDSGACDFSISPSGSGKLKVGGSNITVSGTNSSLELGSLTGANTPFIDFHSSGNNIDYDARLMASAGDSTSGNGKLNVYSTAFRPQIDNDTSLGETSHRWTQLYAATATINTSDERLKQDIEALSDAELRVATALKGLVKKYRFIDAVEAKGDNARIHVGVVAQQVIAAFEAEGLDPMRYGIICYDEWDAEFEWDAELDSQGDEITAAGNRYGVRYEELLAFIIAAL